MPNSRLLRVSCLYLNFILCAASLVGASDAAPNELTEDERAAGWISLFDGQSLYGWRPASKGDWAVWVNGRQVLDWTTSANPIRTREGDCGWSQARS